MSLDNANRDNTNLATYNFPCGFCLSPVGGADIQVYFASLLCYPPTSSYLPGLGSDRWLHPTAQTRQSPSHPVSVEDLDIPVTSDQTPLRMRCLHLLVWVLQAARIVRLKGRYIIGNVGKTASMSMLTLFESREGTSLVILAKLLLWVCLLSLNQGKVQHWSCWQNCFYEYAYFLWINWASMRYSIGNVGRTASMSMLTLFESREGTALVMLAKLLLWVCLLSLNQGKVQHW